MPTLLPSPVFRWFVPAQNGTGLVPAAGYKAKFYSAGTTTPKAIYDVDGTIYPSPSHIATLNSEGYAGIKLGPGSYKLVVTTAADAEVYTQDNINGDGSFGTGFVETVQPTAVAPTFGPNGLAALDTGTNRFTWCAGYWEVGDGGHGFFWNETSADADNGGYIIASSFDPTKRWFRIPDEDGAVRAASFGYIGTKTGNLTDELQSACSYAYSYGYKLLIGPGNVATVGTESPTLSIYAPEFYLEPGSMFTSNGTMTTVLFNGIVTGSREQHFSGCGYAFETNQEDDHPEWVGGFPTGSAAGNATAFALWLASDAGAYTLPPGDWEWSGSSAAFPYPTVPFTMLGSINPTSGENIPTGYYGTDTSRIRANQILLTSGPTITGIGGDAVVVGDVVVTGGMSATESISTDSHVNADGDVSAGLGASGRLTGRVGVSSQRYVAAGMGYVNITPANTSGTSPEVLATISILANALQNAGDRLEIKAKGYFQGASAQGKAIWLKIGALAITDSAEFGSMEDGEFHMECEILLTAPGTAAITNRLFWRDVFTSTTGFAMSYNASTVSVDFTANQSLTLNAQALVSGTIYFRSMSIDSFPAYA